MSQGVPTTESLPLDDTLSRRRLSYTMQDFLQKQSASTGQLTEVEQHDDTTEDNIFIADDNDKTPLLNKFANPFQSSPNVGLSVGGKDVMIKEDNNQNNDTHIDDSNDKEESGETGSPLSSAEKFKKLQMLNSKVAIPNIEEDGFTVELTKTTNNIETAKEGDLTMGSINEEDDSFHVDVAMIPHTNLSSPTQVLMMPTQNDQPLDVDLILRKKSVIGAEMDFNNYTSMHNEEDDDDDEEEEILASTSSLEDEDKDNDEEVQHIHNDTINSIKSPSHQHETSVVIGVQEERSIKHVNTVDEDGVVERDDEYYHENDDDSVIKIKRRFTYDSQSPTKIRKLISRASTIQSTATASTTVNKLNFDQVERTGNDQLFDTQKLSPDSLENDTLKLGSNETPLIPDTQVISNTQTQTQTLKQTSQTQPLSEPTTQPLIEGQDLLASSPEMIRSQPQRKSSNSNLNSNNTGNSNGVINSVPNSQTPMEAMDNQKEIYSDGIVLNKKRVPPPIMQSPEHTVDSVNDIAPDEQVSQQVPDNSYEDNTQYEIPNTSNVSIGSIIPLNSVPEILESQIIERQVAFKPLALEDIWENRSIFVNFKSKHKSERIIVGKITGVDPSHISLIKHDGEMVQVSQKSIFAPICLCIGDIVNYFNDTRQLYYITGLQKQGREGNEEAQFETWDGFTHAYLRRKKPINKPEEMDEPEFKVPISQICLNKNLKSQYKCKVFHQRQNVEKYIQFQYKKLYPDALEGLEAGNRKRGKGFRKPKKLEVASEEEPRVKRARKTARTTAIPPAAAAAAAAAGVFSSLQTKSTAVAENSSSHGERTTDLPFSRCLFVLTGLPVQSRSGTRSVHTSPHKKSVMDKLNSVAGAAPSVEPDYESLVKFVESLGGTIVSSSFDQLVPLDPPVPLGREGDIKLYQGMGLSLDFSQFQFGCILSNKHARTMKYLQCVALGWPCVHIGFVDQCLRDPALLAEWPERVWDWMLPAGDVDQTQSGTGYTIGLNCKPFLFNIFQQNPLSVQIGINRTLHHHRVVVVEQDEPGPVDCMQVVWILVAMSCQVLFVPNDDDITRAELSQTISEHGFGHVYTADDSWPAKVAPDSLVPLAWKDLVNLVIGRRC